MRLSIERSTLLKALGHVQNVVERRNTIPILSNVLLSAEDGQLTLVATDLDIEVSETAAADISAPGQVTAPAHTLYDIARKLPDGSQVVSADKLRRPLGCRRGPLSFHAAAAAVRGFPKNDSGRVHA